MFEKHFGVTRSKAPNFLYTIYAIVRIWYRTVFLKNESGLSEMMKRAMTSYILTKYVSCQSNASNVLFLWHLCYTGTASEALVGVISDYL